LHSPASPLFSCAASARRRLFYLRRRKGAAGACFAQPRLPLFGRAPRHERETAACFYTRRRTGAAGACFVLRTAPPPSFLAAPRQRDSGCSTYVDARARRGRASHSPASLFLVARRVMRERRRLVSTHVDARARRGRASHSPAFPLFSCTASARRRLVLLAYTQGRGGSGHASHSPASPFLFAPRQRDGGWFLHA